LKRKKIQNVNKITTNKQVSSSILGTIIVTIDNHMAVIQIQMGKNTIKDVLLDGGCRVNFIIE
jgi:hypothetical protein